MTTDKKDLRSRCGFTTIECAAMRPHRFTRKELVALLQEADGNGVWSDADCVSEGLPLMDYNATVEAVRRLVFRDRRCGVWTPWSRIECPSCCKSGDWLEDEDAASAVEWHEGEDVYLSKCDSCGHPVVVNWRQADEVMLRDRLRESGFAAALQQTGGMCCNVWVIIDAERDLVATFGVENATFFATMFHEEEMLYEERLGELKTKRWSEVVEWLARYITTRNFDVPSLRDDIIADCEGQEGCLPWELWFSASDDYISQHVTDAFFCHVSPSTLEALEDVVAEAVEVHMNERDANYHSS